MKILMSITVQGKTKKWSYTLYADKKYLKEWQDDGIEINEVVNTAPVWVVEAGLLRVWCFFQDIFNFKFLR